MELTELARRVLESERLEDKVGSPDALSDLSPRSRPVPPMPARPPRLRFHDPRPRARFPKRHELHDPEARGRALHFFANHELLAIELMAVCLLRFPEAPTSFRLGVARTLLEEQDHLRRYRARMAALGVELGDVPVGGHFWRVLAPMRSALEYVTGLSLVFEQANLDHAQHWRRAFDEAGDASSAELMAKVLEDEIGHVKHGVIWFERWRPDGESFEVFRGSLPPGVDPVRAKGPVLEEELRRRAGLSPAFIRALRLHRFSKGRRPRLFIFWPDVEEHCLGRTEPSAAVKALTKDLAPILGLLGSDDDLLWVPRPESAGAREHRAMAGLPTPRAVDDLASASVHRPDAAHPWGLSLEVRRRLEPLAASLRVPLPARDDAGLLNRSLVLSARRRFVDRGWLAEELEGTLCRTEAEVERALAARSGPVVVKALFSAAGRRRRVVQGALQKDNHSWVRGVLASDGGVVVEPWLQRVADFGLVLPAEGSPTLLRFYTTARGSYRGHRLGPQLPPELTGVASRTFEGGLKGLIDALQEVVRPVVPEGPVGVDLLVYRTENGLALHPLVEINARHTMGHIAAALRRYLAPGREALWWHVRRSDVKRVGHARFASWWQEQSRLHPVQTLECGKRRLLGGLVATNDPDAAQVVLTVLSVAADGLEACWRQLGLGAWEASAVSMRVDRASESPNPVESDRTSRPDRLTWKEE